MMIWRNWWMVATLILMTGCKSSIANLQVEKVELINDFPSGSSIEYYENKLFLSGDDATSLLVLDTNFNRIKSIPSFDAKASRILQNLKKQTLKLLQ